MTGIDSAMARDETWFRSLQNRTADEVARFALRRSSTTADADDGVSETFLVTESGRTERSCRPCAG